MKGEEVTPAGAGARIRDDEHPAGRQASARRNPTRSFLRDEQGIALILFAVIVPLTFVMAAVVWDVGNWWVHRKHLQTKVDAAAFAGGGAWGFPCASDIDLNIETQARLYVGEHMKADGSAFTATTLNPQVGGTPGSQIHVVLNGSTWWDDDAGSMPADRTNPVNPSICESKTLDVKATEANNSPLFGWLPFFPDIKRKARVEIQEVEGLSGLLPIAVRLPLPLSAAAVFYDESNGTILDVEYFREDNTLFGLPAGLGGWTTLDPSSLDGGLASFDPPATTGVAIALSVRPACGTPGATPPCFEDSGFATVDALCNQGNVQCTFASGTGASQTVESGLQFIRGYSTGTAVTNGPPELGSVWLDTPTANCGSYFNAGLSSCSAVLHAALDLGSVMQGTPPVETRTSADAEVRYKLVYGDTTATGAGSGACGDDYQPACDLSPSWSTSVTITPAHARHAIAIRVRLRNTTVGDPGPGQINCGGSYSATCEWFFTAAGRSTNVPTDAAIFANPVQRSFMGNVDRTAGIKWLRLSTDENCDEGGLADYIDGEAASLPAGQTHCSYVEMGLQGGIARDQDEPPIALNLGSGSSQRALIDCDETIPNLKSEIVSGCQLPFYSSNKFNTTPFCPGTAGFFDTPKAAPFDNWPPFRCVLTQTTAAANQIEQGFNERIFSKSNNPTCPADDATQWVKGRNYWHRDNNGFDDPTFAWDGDTPGYKPDDWGNELRDDDPRLVTLFFTTYDSFTSPGNEVFPIVGFGNFYITGYGRTQTGGWQGGAPDDPCDFGNDGDLYNGNGNEPPPDIDYSRNTTWVWGHFVNDVQPSPFTLGGSGVLCNPGASFMPCVAVLVE